MCIRDRPSKVSFYRYGGDEYSLIFKDSKRGEVINIIKKIMTIFDSEIIIDKARANISVSFGISHFPSDGNKLELLIKNAHITLSRVKAFSRNSFEFFKKSNDSRLMYDQDFDNYISSFSINQFETYLMPVIETKTNIITGFECLSRVKDKNGEHLNIFEVITSFERNGRIQELDEQVFKHMISMKQLLNKKYKRDIFLSANVSALSFNDDFVDKVIRLFKKAKLEYSTIILELTESYKVDDFEYLIKLFSKLNNAGIKIAIDDFGTGYSSLNYISKFPLYAIKIDKQYVKDYKDNAFNRTLMFTLQSIAKVIDCKLIAEGVDEYETLQFLKENKCEYYQGFLFSKPVELTTALELLDENKTYINRD